ncbi:MAG: hypothetical protein KGQ41_09750, partial [Alphaproteobacteria bacterium]|nr:hypothetical protein [Alphaproteobacteria bacterium]
LTPLPDGADVLVHMDCKNLIMWLEAGALTTKSKKIEPRISKTFATAIAQKARMKSVKIVYTADKNSPNMQEAHRLSSMASSPHKTAQNADQNSRHSPRP